MFVNFCDTSILGYICFIRFPASIYIAFKITNKKITLLKFDETHTSSLLCWVIMLIYMQKYTLSTEI
jgi:hypothetical protein